jgi:hypothetical protein
MSVPSETTERRSWTLDEAFYPEWRRLVGDLKAQGACVLIAKIGAALFLRVARHRSNPTPRSPFRQREDSR